MANPAKIAGRKDPISFTAVSETRQLSFNRNANTAIRAKVVTPPIR